MTTFLEIFITKREKMMSEKMKPKKDHYIAEKELGQEYCESIKCRICFGEDENGEPNGYGCPEQENFIADNDELIFDFDDAYFLVQGQLYDAQKEIDQLKSQIEKMKCCENCKHNDKQPREKCMYCVRFFSIGSIDNWELMK
ncbi:MAG: hypothetical protein ACKOWO_05595 [Sediminibacterium sp.]